MPEWVESLHPAGSLLVCKEAATRLFAPPLAAGPFSEGSKPGLDDLSLIENTRRSLVRFGFTDEFLFGLRRTAQDQKQQHRR